MNDLEKKLWRRVNRSLRFLKVVPFLKMVAICNNLAFGKVDEHSDIDLFIVAKRGRLFTVRILITFILHILGVRRHGKKVAGRFCLSFFVDDSALDLREIAIEKDIYLAFWVYSMKPVLDDSVSGEFLSANTWIREYFDEIVEIDKSRIFAGGSFLKSIMNFILRGSLGDFVENHMRKWQLKRAKGKLLTANKGASLLINEHILKFHNIDRRRDYRNEWFKTYGENQKLNREKFLKLTI